MASPVYCLMWLDPPLTTEFEAGTAVWWHTQFYDPITKVLLDPPTVAWQYSNPPFATVQSIAFNDARVTKNAVGDYSIFFTIPTAGKWILTAVPTSSGVAVGTASLVITAYTTGN